MAHFVGLDVLVQETSVCRRRSRQDWARGWSAIAVAREWLDGGRPAGLCVETRHMKALLKAQQVNKSDRNDARGIAQMMRVGLFKPVHVSQEQRMLLTSRKLVQRKLMDIECDMRGTLRNFGLKVGVVSSIDTKRGSGTRSNGGGISVVANPQSVNSRRARGSLLKLLNLLNRVGARTGSRGQLPTRNVCLRPTSGRMPRLAIVAICHSSLPTRS